MVAMKTSRAATAAAGLGIAGPSVTLAGILLCQLGAPPMAGFALFQLGILSGEYYTGLNEDTSLTYAMQANGVPVVTLDGAAVGEGGVGPASKRLLRLYRETVAERLA